MFRTAAPLALLCSAALVAGSAPAQAADEPRVKQKIVANADLPIGINGYGRTLISSGPMRTNAGQRARVTVTVRTRKGKKVPGKRFKVIRTGKGKVWVKADLRQTSKVTIVMKAPRKGKYAAMRKIRRFTVRPMEAADLGGKGGNSSAWTKLFTFVGESVAGALIGEVVGWGISALFDADKPNDLQPILNKLDEIQQSLNVISSQINDLQKDLRNATCDIQTSGAAKAVSNIQSFNADLRSMIKNRNTSGKDLENWVDNAIRSDSLRSDLGTLDKILMGQGGSGGSVKACASALLDTWVQPLDEAGYYSKLWAYMSYFQQAELLGLNSLVEAYHYMAVRRAKESGKKLPAPKDITDVCATHFSARYGDAVQDYCDRAFTVTSDTYWNIVEQSLQAGAAYGWDTETTADGRYSAPTIAVQKGTDYLWIRDLNQFPWFTERCGPGPIDSDSKKCQRAMLTQLQSRTLREWWDAFGEWRMQYEFHPASAEQWDGLLNTASHNGQKISEVMEQVGFAKGTADKLIVYTGQTVPSNRLWPAMQWDTGYYHRGEHSALTDQYNGACLFDSNFTVADKTRWPLCAEGSPRFQVLLDEYTWNGHDRYTVSPSRLVKQQGSDPDFYQGTLEGPVDGNSQLYKAPSPSELAPGWLSATPGNSVAPRKPAYMWPIAQIPFAKCHTWQMDNDHTYTLPQRNAAGAESMCGINYRQWLKSWMPPPPAKRK